MGIYRMQESTARHTIPTGARASDWVQGRGIACRISWSAVAANHVAPCVSKIGVVDTELCVIEDVECLRTKFEDATFCHFEVLQQAHIEIQAAWVVQKVSASVSERKCSRRDKPIGVSEEGAETLCV